MSRSNFTKREKHLEKEEKRKENRKILLYVEGKTEENYFNLLKNKKVIKNIFKIEKTNGYGSEIYDEKIKSMRESFRHSNSKKYDFDLFDHHFIFDIDNEKERLDFYNSSLERDGEERGYFVWASNPLFELWLLMHVSDEKISKVNGHKKKDVINKFVSKVNESKPYESLFKKLRDKTSEDISMLLENALKNLEKEDKEIESTGDKFTNINYFIKEYTRR